MYWVAANRWRQVLGSTMHCVAGDGVGILTGAVVASVFQLDRVTDIALKAVPGSREPSRPEFRFIMSMALLVGFVTAYPMNWWLVSRHLKPGMMTVRPPGDPLSGGGASGGMHDDHASTGHAGKAQPKGNPPMDSDAESVSNGVLAGMTLLSFLVFGIGLSIAVFGGGS